MLTAFSAILPFCCGPWARSADFRRTNPAWHPTAAVARCTDSPDRKPQTAERCNTVIMKLPGCSTRPGINCFSALTKPETTPPECKPRRKENCLLQAHLQIGKHSCGSEGDSWVGPYVRRLTSFFTIGSGKPAASTISSFPQACVLDRLRYARARSGAPGAFLRC